jgi:hypothetical protein
MTRISVRIATAAVLAIAAAGSAQAVATADSAQPYVAGSGNNQSAAMEVPRPAHLLGPVAQTGSGNNVSVRPLTPPRFAESGYVAVVEGSGENQSVRYVPAPRG